MGFFVCTNYMLILSNNGTNNTHHCRPDHLINLGSYWYGWGNNLAGYNGYFNTRRIHGDRTARDHSDGKQWNSNLCISRSHKEKAYIRIPDWRTDWPGIIGIYRLRAYSFL